MVMTETIRKDLLGAVVPHKDLNLAAAELTESGLLKTAKGLVIRPSTAGGARDTHTGAVSDFTTEERMTYRMNEQVPAQQQQTPAVSPAFAPATATRGTRKRKSASVVPAAPEPVLVKVRVPGVGDIPSQYVHCYVGQGVVVLGMNKYSYMPARASAAADGGLSGVLELPGLAGMQGKRFVYAGYEFVDGNGIRNVLLMEVPAQEVEHDGQEEQ